MTIAVHHALHSDEYAECPFLLPATWVSYWDFANIAGKWESDSKNVWGKGFFSITVNGIVHSHTDREELNS